MFIPMLKHHFLDVIHYVYTCFHWTSFSRCTSVILWWDQISYDRNLTIALFIQLRNTTVRCFSLRSLFRAVFCHRSKKNRSCQCSKVTCPLAGKSSRSGTTQRRKGCQSFLPAVAIARSSHLRVTKNAWKHAWTCSWRHGNGISLASVFRAAPDAIRILSM